MQRRSASATSPTRVARILVIALFSFMAVRIGADFLATGRLTGLLLLASEALVVMLTVFRRAPAAVDRSMRARVLTTLSLLGPPLVRPSVGRAARAGGRHGGALGARPAGRHRRQDFARPQLRADPGQPRHRVDRALPRRAASRSISATSSRTSRSSPPTRRCGTWRCC